MPLIASRDERGAPAPLTGFVIDKERHGVARSLQ